MSRHRLLSILAGACAVGAVVLWGLGRPNQAGSATAADSGAAHRGADLFAQECSSCHGLDGSGLAGEGPDLHGAGAAAADFYLRTGRMPLANPGGQPLRSRPRYDDAQIRKLVAYVGSLGGPRIPKVDPGSGDVSEGQQLFESSCSGCHAITGEGGVAIGAYAPPLKEATPTQVGEAIRVGPYLMPAFGRRQLDDHQVDSIARYVTEVVDHPQDSGGWGIGHIGPVPEGMVAWLLAAAALILIALVIGERARGEQP